MRVAQLLLLFIFILGLIFLISRLRLVQKSAPASNPVAFTPVAASQTPGSASINIDARNLLLRRGPDFKVYVPWLHGQMTAARRGAACSLDNLDSFYLDIQNGVLRANIGDIAHYLNAGSLANSPLKDIVLSGDGNQIKLTATLHKVVPLPIEMIGDLSPAAGNSLQIAVKKISVLKIPFKGLFGDMHITVSDFFSKPIPGIKVSGDTILLDTQQLLPAPHIRGSLSGVRIVNPDLEEIYGPANAADNRSAPWRNFLRLRDGALDFGKLTMRPVDLIMIDTSSDAWFDLDLANYQTQLARGYTRMTPQNGLEVFMPDVAQSVKH